MIVRKHGKAPYSLVVAHGGPGAAGSAKPLCEALGKTHGVLEPFQTEKSVLGQIDELRRVIEAHATMPVILIGHSWGAMLGFMFTATYPNLVKKLILVSSGMLEEGHQDNLHKNRERNLTPEETTELASLRARFATPEKEGMDDAFRRFGRLMDKVDSYRPIEIPIDDSHYRYAVFASIWPEAHAMRKRGEMIAMGEKITCDVVAIHGDQDPHPGYAIKASLENVIDNPRFYALKDCGHTPWKEREAKDAFFAMLAKELSP